LRVSSLQSLQASERCQAIEPIPSNARVALPPFHKPCPLQLFHLAQETPAIRPALIRIGQIAKRRISQRIHAPEQGMKKLLSLAFHMNGRIVAKTPMYGNQ
jgi:hypothetical protein